MRGARVAGAPGAGILAARFDVPGEPAPLRNDSEDLDAWVAEQRVEG